MGAALLDMGLGAQHDDAATGLVGLADAGPAADEGAGGEIRATDVGHQFVYGDGRVLHQGDQAVDHLGEVVRRDLGGHANGDALGAVDQDVGDARRQDRGLEQGVVVVGNKIDRLLVQVADQFLVEPGHARLGVAHGRGRVAVHGAEVALAVHQRIAHGEVLGHAHQGVVGGDVAVRMELTDDVTDDAGRLDVGPVVGVAQFPHGEQGAAVDRLEAVAHIRQGTADDHRHGVVQVGPAQLPFDRDGRLLIGFCLLFCHSLNLRGARKGAKRLAGDLFRCPGPPLPGRDSG